jgi:endoglucanase
LIETEEEAVNNSFAFAALWSQTFNIPIHLGEFGAYEPGDINSRVRWTTTVREAAEANNIPFSYWEFGAGFGIFNPSADQWRLQLLQSLIPEFAN